MKKTVAIVLLNALAFGADPTSPHTWKIASLQSPVYVRDQNPRLTVTADRITIADKRNKSVLEIPRSAIVRVVYTPVSFNRSQQVAGNKSGERGLWQPLSGGGCTGDVGCGGLVLLYALALVAAAPMHGRSHYIRITWNDRGVEQQLQFEAGKDDYVAINAALQSLVGAERFTDLEAEQRKLEAEIANAAPRAVTMKLDRPSVFNGYHLLPGAYSLVAVDRGEGRAELFVFSPTIELSKLKASAWVKVSATKESDEVEYDRESPRIAALRASGQTFTVVEPPPPQKSVR